MPDPAVRSCVLHVVIPERPRRCPDVVPLAITLIDQLREIRVVAWTGGAGPDARCVEQAAAVASRLESATGIWPGYSELCDARAVLPLTDRVRTMVVAVASGERRRVLRDVRTLTDRSGAHLAIVGHVGVTTPAGS